MRIINLLSVLGLLVSFYIAYNRSYLGFYGPTYYPFMVKMLLLVVFVLSYAFSLIVAKSSMGMITALVAVFMGMIITGIYCVLHIMGKVYYPIIFNIPGCYIQFPLLLILTYQWSKKR